MNYFWFVILLLAIDIAWTAILYFLTVRFCLYWSKRRGPKTVVDNSTSAPKQFTKASLIKSYVAIFVLSFLSIFLAVAIRPTMVSVALILFVIVMLVVGTQLKCLACGQSVVFQQSMESEYYRNATWGLLDPNGFFCDILFKKRLRCLNCGQLYVLQDQR